MSSPTAETFIIDLLQRELEVLDKKIADRKKMILDAEARIKLDVEEAEHFGKLRIQLLTVINLLESIKQQGG